MNRKLQALTEEISQEIRARLPNLTLEVLPRGRKSAYIYMIAPNIKMWEDADVWDIVDEITEKQVDILVKTGYSIMSLPHQPLSWPATAAPARLREKPAEWHEEPKGEPSPVADEA